MEAELVTCLMLVFASNSLLEAATIRAPDLTRKNIGENCKLRWMVSGTFTSYTILSLLENGNPRSLGLNADTEYDSVRGIITLNIWNVQLEDAGNYVLTLNTGSTPNPSSNATLFVYGPVYSSINNPSGKTQFIEGDIVEPNCSVSSWSSTPQAFRKRLYYSWTIYSPAIGQILVQNISTGPAMTVTGDEVIGCSLKNDGQVLVVNTTQFLYAMTNLYCRVQEEGSSAASYSSSTGFSLLHRPFVYNFSPLSKKYNLVSPTAVPSYSFGFYVNSNPPLSSYSNWSFVDSLGNNKELPLTIGFNTTGNVLSSVSLSTPNPYGNYSATLYNAIGSTTVTFQVAKAGLPEAPTGFKVRYNTYSLVSLQWRCGFFNGDLQVVTVRLRNIVKDTDVQTLKTSLFSDLNCYNSLFTTVFQVDPEVDYEGTIWSTNANGQSSTASVSFKTPSKPNFSVTCNDISVTDSTAVVKVTTSAVNVWLNVSCCVEATGQCVLQSFTLLSTENQILLNQLPEGEEYVFDFIFFDVYFSQTYGLSIVKGLRISRTSGCNTNGEDKSLFIAVIVLAALLGVSILLLSICLIVNLRMKRRHSTTIPKSTQQQTRSAVVRNLPVDENYEGIQGGEDSVYYTAIQNTPPNPPPPKRTK